MATEKSKNNTELESLPSLVDLDNMSSMDELLKGSKAESFTEGAIISGRIAEKTDNGALVDIGCKAEGFIPKEEFQDWDEVKPDDSVDVYLEQIEDEDNQPVLSIQKAIFLKNWEKVTSKYNEGDIVKGVVKHRVKGGLIVDLEGVESFLPGSQIDIAPIRNMDDLISKEFDLKIVKINEERKNIVVSRRELLEADRAEKRSTMLQEMKIGDIYKGTIKNITDFGAFIDLGGVDGLLHITDMSWGRISHPSEMVEVGQEVEVMILDIDYNKERVSLGMKQKSKNPWESVAEKYPIGTKVTGKVVNIMPYGAFVEIEEGIEGLIHVSEMSWTKRVSKASDILNIGDEVEAVILDIQPDSKKISLGLRQTTQNPWELLAQRYPVGTRIQGKVRNMTSYGAFIEIENDIDGMIHVSDMSWTKKINNPAEVVNVGDEIEAVILAIDPDQQRISLGMKQMEQDPWENIEELYKIGDIVKGKITKITAFGAFVELSRGIDGLIHVSQISDEHVENVKDVLEVGQTVEARVIKIDKEERRIGLSIKAAKKEYTREDLAATGEKVDEAMRDGSTMVDIGEALNDSNVDNLESSKSESSTSEKTETKKSDISEETNEESASAQETESAQTESPSQEEKPEKEESKESTSSPESSSDSSESEESDNSDSTSQK